MLTRRWLKVADRIKIAELKEMREPNTLYYVKSNNDGYLEVWKVKMARGRKNKVKA